MLTSQSEPSEVSMQISLFCIIEIITAHKFHKVITSIS